MFAFIKRIALFLAMNLAVLILISIVVLVAEQVFGIRISSSAAGGYGPLFILALIVGFTGSFLSLAISRWMAKRLYGIEPISEANLLNYPHRVQAVYTTVANIARSNGITMPEVGVYESPEPNAFATGPSKNRALVAVSTGLLEQMNDAEVEGVIGHEMSHILNGDMVTMTLLQGVLNTFVFFLARVIGNIIDRVVLKNEDEGHGWGYILSVIVLEILLSILASLILMAFSRYREYRADHGSAKLVGKDKMIRALKRLQLASNIEEPTQPSSAIAAMRISSHGGWLAAFSSHPPLEKRIAALENDYSL